MFDRGVVRVARACRALHERVVAIENRQLMRQLGECGRDVRIGGSIHVSSPERVVLEDNVRIGRGAYIRARGGLFVGANTRISRNLVLYTQNHRYEGELLPYDHELDLKPVHIGRNVWIGMNVCIAPGTTIGDGAIVGIGTTVAGTVPPLTIVGSSPVRTLGLRDSAHYEQLESARKFHGQRP